MLEIILNYLITHFPQIAGYAVLFFFVVYVTFKLAKFYLNTNKTNEELPGIKFSLAKIDKGLTTLNQILLEKTVISQSCYSNEASPRAVSDLGEKVLQQSGADALFETLAPELIDELEKTKPDSLLELERNALQILLAKMDDPRFKDIQNFVFQHPTFDSNPLTYTDVLFLMSLNLRDSYRKRYPQSPLE